MSNILSQVFLPLSLAIIMLGMGMTLVPADFGRIGKYPKAVLGGLANQLILLPVVGFLLTIVFSLEPSMAVGLMILTVCPGGATSNLITQVCRGNIALSVTLTAVASFLSIITIPFVLSNVLEYFGTSSGVTIELPIADTVLQIMVIIIIPISLGMIIRHYRMAFANRMEKPMRMASTVIFVLVFIAVVAANFDLIGDAMRQVGIAALLLNLITMGLGYLTARVLHLPKADTISIAIESGIQNGTLAFVIATTILSNIEMAVPTAAYTIWMFVTGGIMMYFLGRNGASENARTSD